MYWGKQVIVTDIFEDPLWEDYRELAAASGLRACWSVPFRDHAGRVLGTFAVYYDQTRSTTDQDLMDLRNAAYLAGVAVELAFRRWLDANGVAYDLLDFAQERFGLQRALAECLRAMVAARLRGHPIISILGGGTYGAAYLALAAPSHRILAIRGTSVAPMAPQVLRALGLLNLNPAPCIPMT